MILMIVVRNHFMFYTHSKTNLLVSLYLSWFLYQDTIRYAAELCFAPETPYREQQIDHLVTNILHILGIYGCVFLTLHIYTDFSVLKKRRYSMLMYEYVFAVSTCFLPHPYSPLSPVLYSSTLSQGVVFYFYFYFYIPFFKKELKIALLATIFCVGLVAEKRNASPLQKCSSHGHLFFASTDIRRCVGVRGSTYEEHRRSYTKIVSLSYNNFTPIPHSSSSPFYWQGLDAVAALDIAKTLRTAARLLNVAIIATQYQVFFVYYYYYYYYYYFIWIVRLCSTSYLCTTIEICCPNPLTFSFFPDLLFQLSQDIFEQFDKVLVIQEGHSIYFGPTQEAMAYFESKLCLSIGYLFLHNFLSISDSLSFYYTHTYTHTYIHTHTRPSYALNVFS